MKALAPHYEIVIYTASLQLYADPLMNRIDPEQLCSARLYREHCTRLDECYVKDLSKLGRNLKDCIIVENSPYSYRLDQRNAVPIVTWYDDESDTELYKLIPFLEELAYVYDVRTVLSLCVDINDPNVADDSIDVEKGRQLIAEMQRKEM